MAGSWLINQNSQPHTSNYHSVIRILPIEDKLGNLDIIKLPLKIISATTPYWLIYSHLLHNQRLLVSRVKVWLCGSVAKSTVLHPPTPLPPT